MSNKNKPTIEINPELSDFISKNYIPANTFSEADDSITEALPSVSFVYADLYRCLKHLGFNQEYIGGKWEWLIKKNHLTTDN
jgi:hypothetical protein